MDPFSMRSRNAYTNRSDLFLRSFWHTTLLLNFMRQFLFRSSLRRYLWMMCDRTGIQCSLGHMSLLWNSLGQFGHLYSSFSLSMEVSRSLIVQQCSQSILDCRRISVSSSLDRQNRIEQVSDLMSHMIFLDLMKPRDSSLGSCFFSMRIRSVMMENMVWWNRAHRPISPFCRMNSFMGSPFLTSSSQGWHTFLMMCLAISSWVRSVKFFSMARFLKMLRLDSIINYSRMSVGRDSSSWSCSTKLNSCFIRKEPQMKLFIRFYSYSDTQFFRLIRCNVFTSFFLSRWRLLRSLMRFPRQLMLQERVIQLTSSMNMRHRASWKLVAARSPKPTVSMTVVPQQYPHTYLSYQGRSIICFWVSQLFSGLKIVIPFITIERMCAKHTFMTRMLSSPMYCSRLKLVISIFSIGYNFWPTCDTFQRAISLSRWKAVSFSNSLSDISTTMRLMASGANSYLRQCLLISMQEFRVLPSTVFFARNCRTNYMEKKRAEDILSTAAAVVPSASGNIRHRVQRMLTPKVRNTLKRPSTACKYWFNTSPSLFFTTRNSPSNPQSTGFQNATPLLIFATKLSTRRLTLFLRTSRFKITLSERDTQLWSFLMLDVILRRKGEVWLLSVGEQAP